MTYKLAVVWLHNGKKKVCLTHEGFPLNDLVTVVPFYMEQPCYDSAHIFRDDYDLAPFIKAVESERYVK